MRFHKKPPKKKTCWDNDEDLIVKTKISLLVPYRSDGAHRDELWDWLKRYWECKLPEAEIIMGKDEAADFLPFSKTVAVNNAFAHSCGDIIVILDADAYISAKVIRHCAQRIRQARKHDARVWFVPFTHMYRLTPKASEELIHSDPCEPRHFSCPPDPCDVDDNVGSSFGRKFGALIQVMPREAFEEVGGMDPRFRGWGGEDVSFLRAVDTLWARHKNLPGDVLHLWHEKLHSDHKQHNRGKEQWLTRVWGGQDAPRANDWLSIQYNRATNKPVMMRELVDKGLTFYDPLSLWRTVYVWALYLLGIIESPKCRGL